MNCGRLVAAENGVAILARARGRGAEIYSLIRRRVRVARRKRRANVTRRPISKVYPRVDLSADAGGASRRI
ncbi:MAG TPA: hypothetical protein VF703_03700 [Pyrinomonadaceae bacterium]|jgi:hypothetical protein